jgi:3-oxoacyl-[acyl-carrier protein] reductase
MSEPRVIAITGASRGIGRGIAEYFAKAGGWKVHGCSRSETVEFAHENYAHHKADMTDEASVRQWVRAIKAKDKGIDVLVCNVGVVKSALFVAMTPTSLFDEFYQSSLKATFFACREVAKTMLLQKRGRIINIGSTITLNHEPGAATYAANKAAIIEFTKVMAKEMVQYGVTCNVVSPSLVMTPATEAMGESWKEHMLSLQTIKRTIDAAELANVIEFFARPESACITGQVINTCFVS